MPVVISPRELDSEGAHELLARLDGLYARRDDRAVLGELRALVDQGVARAPADYEILWRAARVYFWMGDDPSLGAEERSRLGKLGWDHAERAIAASPNRADGHFTDRILQWRHADSRIPGLCTAQ